MTRNVALPASPISVVGVGASAGGLEALSELVAELPQASGMAFLIATHLDPQRDSLLVPLLQKKTALTVVEAAGQRLAPDHIYVIPPDSVMRLAEDRIVLTPRQHKAGANLPINALFQSLAGEWAEKAVGVVLSGSGTDGTEGLKAIKEAGGIIFVQEPASARFPGMPDSAIRSGCADRILDPAGIGAQLRHLVTHPFLREARESEGKEEDAPWLPQVFALLYESYHADFSLYKASTVNRRLRRRMALQGVLTLPRYLEQLRSDAAERAALFNDLLIRVTSFFRDRSAYAALSAGALPALLESRSASDPIRVWVPACATGEEVYSIAIALVEAMADRPAPPIQIFGTDLSEAAVSAARLGCYPESIAERVSPERLQRFFQRERQGYCVVKSLRELCLFARHNLVVDPPFSRMDLVSCRNMLIYLDPVLQQRVLGNLHYALKPQGYLFLGGAENAGYDPALFSVVDRRHHIFRKLGNSSSRTFVSRLPPMASGSARGAQAFDREEGSTYMNVLRQADALLLSRFSPASLLVDEGMNILQIRGQADAYIGHPEGAASLQLHRMVRPGILTQLLPVIEEARQSGRTARRNDLRVEANDTLREVGLEVIPLHEAGGSGMSFLVVFDPESRVQGRAARRPPAESALGRRNEELEEELEDLRKFMQSSFEAHEAGKEESSALQEELQSANEEFRSTNEELETAKEELQATNEELITTNEELRSRTAQLEVLNKDLSSARATSEFAGKFADAIIDSVSHPLVVLDAAFRVVRANRSFYETCSTQAQATVGHSFLEIGKACWGAQPLVAKMLAQVLTGELADDVRACLELPPSGSRSMVLRGRKVPGLENRPDLILVAIDDISEVEHSLHAREADDRRKDDFLATLAHELRNPLAPIRNALHALGLLAKDEALKPPLAMIDRQVTNINRLVDDLMDVSRITEGKITLDCKVVDLRLLLAETVTALAPDLEQRGLELVMHLPDAPVLVSVDPVRMDQIVGNLLINAGKYTDRGGHIVVTLDTAAGHAVLTVADDGMGIAPEALPHVFDLFMQSDQARRRADGGLGIGLTLVQRLVQLQGGSVRAASPGVGKGSEFELRLPIAGA